ncbi:hypothetical protein WP3W18E06_47320 [Raoultella ornithinolytica]|nr:hypothetical protein WP3W18E06_47320 [Raoultella ornithinolytica]VTN07537.1 Uncharacterised protein [Raoultella ornithinolytica]
MVRLTLIGSAGQGNRAAAGVMPLPRGICQFSTEVGSPAFARSGGVSRQSVS